MRFLAIIVTLFTFAHLGNAQDEASIQWMTWEEAQERMKEEPRKIFVDIYTDWCGWCKKMDVATFQKPHIVKYLNEHYYAIKFNAEQTEDIVFNDKKYRFVQQGRRGYHELAFSITRGQLSYPTIVFVDEELNVIQPIPGFRDSMEFEKMMTYFGNDMHKQIPWSLYEKDYQPLRVKNAKAKEVKIVKDDCP